MALPGSDLEATMDVVLKNIYASCDPEESNQVPASKLIEFISPYLMQDVIALESLKQDLDPNDQNSLISLEKFYEVMNMWTKKISNSNEEEEQFNRTPSQIDEIDDKDLPFIQSTPRASFGQKLLNCEELLNLSNLTSTDLTGNAHTNDDSTVGFTKQMLEEEVKRLEHQLKQAYGEMDMMKNQITITEEQNEQLQFELTRYRTRLTNEQQMVDHLQKDKLHNEELRDEINARKLEIENLNRKLHVFEKDANYMSTSIQKLESENDKLTKLCEEFNAKEQKLKKELFGIKIELEEKEAEISMIKVLNEELKHTLNQEKKLIEDLTQENDLLDYKKNTLEKCLSKRYSLSPYKTKKINTSQGSTTIPLYSSPHLGDSFINYNPSILRKLGSPVSPCIETPIYSRKSLNPFYYPTNPNNTSNIQDHSYDEDCSFEAQVDARKSLTNPQVSLHMELFQIGQLEQNNKEQKTDEEWSGDDFINSLATENESLKEKLNNLNNKNEELQTEIETANDKVESLSKKLENLQKEKACVDEKVQALEAEKRDLENRIKKFEMTYPELLIKNQDKIQDLEDRLSKIRKDYANLQTQYKAQEVEIADFKNKFNFEIPFKNLQIELTQKTKELGDLRESCASYTNLIQKLTSANTELNSNLKDTKQELQAYQKRSEEVEKINEDTQLTTVETHSQLQKKTEYLTEVISVNKCYEEKIHYLEKELGEKLREITHLKDKQRDDMSIKNKMWKNYKDLENTTDKLKVKLKEYENSLLELKEEMGKLLRTHNDEVTKNCELCEQIRQQKEELCRAVTKYQEENDKNIKLSVQIEDLKRESDNIKQTQINTNKTILQKLADYEDILEKYDIKIKELESFNETLKLDLQEERSKNQKLSEYETMFKVSKEKIRDLEFANNSLKADLQRERRNFEKLESFNEALKLDLREERNKNQTLSEYENMFKVNKETIRDLEFANNSLKADLQRERRNSEKTDSSVDSISFSSSFDKSADSKTRSFEKQQLVIDKLRYKVNDLETELQREKSKNLSLKTEKDQADEKIFSLQEKLEEIQKESILGKQSFIKTISDLKEKYKYQEIKGSKAEEKITKLLDTIAQIEETKSKLELEIENKNSMLKQQLEVIENSMTSNHDLNRTVQELKLEVSKKENALKGCIAENSNLRILCDNSEKKLPEFSLKVFELERELYNRREEIKMLSHRVQEKDETIQELRTKVKELDMKSSDMFLELSEKEHQYALILEEKEILQDRLSKIDDKKDSELLDLEEKIRNSRALLQSIETDIGLARRVLNEFSKGEDTSRNVQEEIEIVRNCDRQLFKALSMALKSWQVDLQGDSRFVCLPPLGEEDPSKFEESLSGLNDRINIAVMLLEILSTKAPMDSSAGLLDALGHNKTLNKFTLRPARLIVGRPVSPDSPSLDVGEECGDVSKSTKILDSPDSRTVEDNELTNINEDAAHLFSPLGLSLDDAFPHVTDSFLEKIGLHEDGTKQTLSAPETERVFATFSIQIALDSTDIKERLEKQREECEKQHKRLLHLMKDISMRLREHRCIGAMDSIKPVFVLLEDLRYLLREIMKISGQYGILSCEQRMMKCWNLVTEYITMLKKETSLSPTVRKLVMVDKEVGTTDMHENIPENLIVDPVESRRQNFDDKLKRQKPTGRTDDMVGHRSIGYISRCKTLMKWLVFVLFVTFLIFVSIHWQCQMSPENQICPLDAIIQKINIGTPPY